MPALPLISFYFPEKRLDNTELSALFNVPEAKILKSTGIRSRYIAAKNELASDMALKATENFFTEHAVKRQEIDFLIFCSECYDYIAPATSCILQDKLHLNKSIGCIDMPYGCSGYVYGLAMAKGLIASGIAKNVLFITADTSTKTLAENNLELRSIFSDAASVTHLNSENLEKTGQFVFGTDGSGCHNIYISRSAFKNPADAKFMADEKLQNGKMIMDGMEIFNFGLRVVPKLVEDTLEKNKLKAGDIDLFVFHQPTRFLLEVLQKKMNIPAERFFINIEAHGNTVSATIPIALKDAEKAGKIKKGMNILLAGFGIGYSWAGTVLKT